jgi:hypothetical protein
VKEMSLKEKLEQINKDSSSQNTDIEQVKNEWIERVEALFAQTTDWLAPYLKEGLFKIVEKVKNINEEQLGAYRMKQLEYEFGEHCLIIEPMGRNIIGSWGRIDIYFRGNKTDKYLLILLGDTFDTATWYLSSFQDKRLRFDWNKDNFEKLIENWIDNNSFKLI